MLAWPTRTLRSVSGSGRPWATEAICDGATHWMWDPARSKYVLYGRTRKALPEVVQAWSKYDWYKRWFSGRAVARLESPDFLKWDFTRPDTAIAATAIRSSVRSLSLDICEMCETSL